jgi:4-hydroxybenzoate polyprenyltransferase
VSAKAQLVIGVIAALMAAVGVFGGVTPIAVICAPIALMAFWRAWRFPKSKNGAA